MAAVQVGQHGAPIAGADRPLQRDGQGLHDGDVDTERPGAGRHLQADEPGADHHGPARHRQFVAQGDGVLDRAEIVNAGTSLRAEQTCGGGRRWR